jgi:hypothetical protein
MDFLSIDDNTPFNTHAEILNKVFQKKTQKGTPPKLALRGGYEIKKNKWAAFFCLAEQWDKGGWYSPKKNNKWLNIPDGNEKAFTQVELNKINDEYFQNNFPKKDIAVFMYRKGTDGKYAYYFYGIFERFDVHKNLGVCIFMRTSTILEYSKWKAL